MSKVLVNFIQDRSGSMSSVWSETVSGFKQFVKELRDGAAKDGVEYLLSLTVFDTVVDTPIIAEPLAEVDVDTFEKFGPRGSTALYDAVGVTIKNTEDNRHGADKIICVIVTDGHENSSREYTKDSLHASIEAKLQAGNWTFTYLGTQPETWDDASRVGISLNSAATYTPARAQQAYQATSRAVRSLSASSRMGSRSLLRDHLSPQAAAQAGMKIGSVTNTPKQSPPATPTSHAKPRTPTRRWS